MIGSGFVYREKPDGTLKCMGFSNRQIKHDKIVEIPEYEDGKKVSEIAETAFQNDSMERLFLPRSIKKIDKYAFHKCPNLKHVVIGGMEIIQIEEGAFQECKSLTDFEKFGYIELVGHSVFANCTSLEKVDPCCINKIPEYSFWGCRNLNYFSFMSKNLIVEAFAFENCNDLKEIDILHDFQFHESFWNILKKAKITCEDSCKMNELAYLGCEIYGLDELPF